MSVSVTSRRMSTTLFVLVAAPAAILLSAVSPARSQTVVSLRAGANSTSVNGIEGSKTGLHVGAGLNVGLTDHVGLQLGASLARKGLTPWSATRFDPNTETTEVLSLNTALDYVEVSTLLHLEIPSSTAVSAHIVVGPVLGVHIGCELTQTTSVTTRLGETLDEQETSSECPASPKALDLGAMGGVGVDFDPSDHLRLTLDLLYNLGLTTIYPVGDAKNRTIYLVAGVGFPVG